MTVNWSALWSRIIPLLEHHIILSFSALALAICLALPLAIWAQHNRHVARISIALTSLIQTIPALALLALFYPFLLALRAVLGDWVSPFGFLPSLLALTLYALLPILRSALTGLQSIDPAITEAANGLGMNRWQKLLWVDAPLAAPQFMGGIRTAAVWTIGAATLSTTIGQPSLGDLIFAGLQTQNWVLVLAGCFASAGLAMTTDFLLAMVENGIKSRKKWRIWSGLGVIFAGVALAMLSMSGALSSGKQGEVITIGAKRFTEQYILVRAMGQRLEAAGYRVRYREGLGSAVIYGALANGDIDFYVDYSGTIWTNEMKREDKYPRDEMNAAIKKWAAENHGVAMLGALGFENSYAFAVRREMAEKYGLQSMQDVARQSRQMVFATDVEFLERPEWAAVKAAYPLNFKQEKAMESAFMYQALSSGDADIISAYSSDGRIAAYDFTVMADPKQAIPPYDALMLASPAMAGRGEILALLRPLIGGITVETMRTANHMVDRQDDKKSAREAGLWLNAQINGAVD